MRGRLITALAAAIALLAAPAARAGVIPLPAGMPPQLQRAAQRIATVPERRISPATPIPSFELKAGHGYRIKVGPVGASVGIVVEKGGHDKSESVYLTRGVVSSRRLKASFDRLGELDMRFHPRVGGHSRGLGSGCRGKRLFPTERGVFTGRFRFDGEGGYLRLRVHRAVGEVLLPAERCADHRAPRPLRASASTVFYPVSIFPRQVEADWRDGVDAREFFAAGDVKRSFYLAEVEEALGRVATVRIAFATGPTTGIQVNGPLTAARVSPPAPFHGAGTYRAAPDGGVTWDGPLAVSFPGVPRFPLTGERFRTSVWRAP